ncbi:nuclear transport factor 2 family protein [Flavobacterium sp. 3-210]
MNVNELADRIAIRELIDRISMLGDQKKFEQLAQLFSEDAVSETILEGNTILHITGRKEMARTFAEFLQKVETVYHFNGQQIIEFDGDNARGTCYCFITLIGSEDGKKIKTKIGAVYEDHYIRTNNQWLVSKRLGRFEWQEKNAEIPC